MSDCYLVRPDNTPAKACFPVIDAHNHLWGNFGNAAKVVQVMDAVGVISYCDLTANMNISWVEGGYQFQPADTQPFFEGCAKKFPGRFYCHTTAAFNRPTAQPLFTDAKQFVEESKQILRQHVQAGARGLKVLKELGLHYRDGAGKLINCDDERLGDIWEEAGRLGVPVLIHQADPYGFFEPITPANEHYDTLQKYPSWSFADRQRFPTFQQLQQRYRNLVKNHPNTTFFLPHVANWPENLDYVGGLLEELPNAYLDFSARIDELGRQPHSTREFLIRWQDRVYFGSDMPASVEMYRCYFRFLETFDEYFIPPDYDGSFGRHRWRICGLGLPREVLRKIYYQNALKLIPGLRADLQPLLKESMS